jgi:glycine dehydrogenase subunit 1
MVCRLTGMEVANASHYDGATALAEAALMALDVTRGNRDRVLVSPTVNPRYRAVLRTYLGGAGAEVAGDGDGLSTPEDLAAALDGRTAALIVQDPDFLGRFQRVEGLADRVHAAGALLIAVFDPIALGLFRAPGDYGADIAVADGQPLGIPPSFGGPHLGIFATRHDHIRRMVGRLVGQTADGQGRRGYVLTLGTREQHIRRARATSNICTNAALTALAASVYLATVGKTGLAKIARLCHDKAHYAASRLSDLPGVDVNPQNPDAHFYKEFTVRLPVSVADVNATLAEQGLLGGFDLGTIDPALTGQMLLAVTEVNTRQSIDRLVEAIRAATA